MSENRKRAPGSGAGAGQAGLAGDARAIGPQHREVHLLHLVEQQGRHLARRQQQLRPALAELDVGRHRQRIVQHRVVEGLPGQVVRDALPATTVPIDQLSASGHSTLRSTLRVSEGARGPPRRPVQARGSDSASSR